MPAPSASAAARATIEAELGQPLDALFLSFEDAAISAASIAQVHYAVTKPEADPQATGQEVAVKVDESETVVMALAPGQASFHNVKSAHGSGPNNSADRRIGLSLHYMPTHTKQTLADWDSAALVRGEDRFGHFVHAPRPAIDFDPEAVAFHNRATAATREIVYKDSTAETHTL